MELTKQHLIMDENTIRRSLTRIAHEIVERNKGIDHCILVGIRTRGVYLAHRLAEKIAEIEEVQLPVLELDVTRYRDDLRQPVANDVISVNEPLSIEEKKLSCVMMYFTLDARSALHSTR